MKEPELIIDIKPDGTVTMEAVGYEGKACLTAAAPFEAALGKVTARTEKPEMHRDQQQAQQPEQQAQ